MQRGPSQVLFGSGHKQEVVLWELQEALLCTAGCTLAQVAQRLWTLLLGDLQKPPGHGPEHPALDDQDGGGVGPHGPRGPCQPQTLGIFCTVDLCSLTAITAMNTSV